MPEERALRLERGGVERDRGHDGGNDAGESQPDTPTALVGAPRPADMDGTTLTEADIADYRRRIVDGVYNSREIADEVARRLLQSGDV